MSELERLHRRYREHHETAREREFVYGGRDRADVFARLVGGPGKRILDVGCRYGALTRAYADGNDVLGIDVDRDALAEAERTLGIETRWVDVEAGLPLDDDAFDVVVAGEFLEHVRTPEDVVADIVRVLRPGGAFVGSVPNAFRLKNRLRFFAGRPPETDPTHLHLFTPTAVRALLEPFEDVELHFVVGRLVRVHPRLMANVIVFRAVKPRG